jgi:sugar O-acyltransferase (sialic acid O-acetyltransferase NeuD family)
LENPVVIFGAGALGHQAYDIFRDNNVVVYGFLDDKKELQGTEIGEVSVLGDTDDGGFLKVIGQKCEAFVAIGERAVRQQITEMLQSRRKTMPVNAIHKTAVISDHASIGHGNLVGARTVISAKSRVGHHTILQAGVIIEPMVVIGDFVNVGSGAVIGSGVEIASEVFIGQGVTLVSGIKVGKGARIGAGSVVVGDVPEGATFFGNPAQKV